MFAGMEWNGMEWNGMGEDYFITYYLQLIKLLIRSLVVTMIDNWTGPCVK